jgi:hypothetical protein
MRGEPQGRHTEDDDHTGEKKTVTGNGNLGPFGPKRALAAKYGS